jgi:integrase
MVKKTTLHKFVTQQGYELVEKFGKKKTSELLKMSRTTLYTLLKEFPTKPDKTLPKYVFQWEETAGNQMFIEKYQGKIRCFKTYVVKGMEAWLLLNKKDPVSWDIEDFRKIWNAKEFKDSMTGKIAFQNAIIFRKWMRAIGKGELGDLEEFKTDGLKRPKGMRRQWFLDDDEIKRLIEAMDRPELLVSFTIALLSGGRVSSIVKSELSKGIRPMDVDEKNSAILMFEPKLNKYVPRLFHPKAIELVKRYINDFHIKPNESLFLNESTMRKYLKKVSLKAGVSKIAGVQGAWHITKHTFVTQGVYHGLSIEVVSDQAGTDPKTLLDFYAGMKEKKLRAELLGEKSVIEPFHVWSLRVIIEPAIKQYEKLQVNEQRIFTRSDIISNN